MATDVMDRHQTIAGRRHPLPLGRWLLTGVVLGWFALMILVPTLTLLREALSGGVRPLLDELAKPEVTHAFWLTIVTTAIATVVNTLFGLAFAIVLVRHNFPGKGLINGIVDLPFAVSPVVAGLMLVILYGPNSFLGRHLDNAGFPIAFALPGMVLACLFVTLPFVVREVVPVLQEFGVDQEEVAYTLGAGRWTTFWRVTLPSIRWGIAYGVTLTVARSLGEFGALLVISGNLLGKTQTATLYVHDAVQGYNFRGAYAASLVLAGTSFVLLIGMESLRKYVMKREGKS